MRPHKEKPLIKNQKDKKQTAGKGKLVPVYA
jgi:hypothetical protein